MRVDRHANPEYRAAVEREQALRDVSFLDLPADICGIEIRQMTARDYLILDGLGSPFVCGGPSTDFDVVQFLWQLQSRRPLSQVCFAWRCGRLDGPVIGKIRDYVDVTFQDAPGGSDGPRYVGWLASVVDTVASEYGWPEDVIINMPLRRLFQYCKRIRMRLDPNAIMFNPSDEFRTKHLKLARQRKKLLALLRERAKQ